MNESILKLIGEIIGAIAIIEGFMIYFTKSKENILLFKFISDFLWFVNFICTGGWTGAILNLIGMCREAVFSQRGKRKLFSGNIWLWLFLILSVISPTVSLLNGSEGLWSILPALGSVIAVIAFYHNNATYTRIIGLVAQVLWLIYSIGINNFSSAVCNIVLIISAVAGIIRDIIGNKKARGETRGRLENTEKSDFNNRHKRKQWHNQCSK